MTTPAEAGRHIGGMLLIGMGGVLIFVSAEMVLFGAWVDLPGVGETGLSFIPIAMVMVGLGAWATGRGPTGRCCWCRRRLALRWQRTNDSHPGHVAKEGRCMLCWNRQPGHLRDFVEVRA